MPQKNELFNIGRQWDFLEPGMVPEWARTDHIKLKAAATGTFVTYRQGQVVCQNVNGTNDWAKKGTANYTGAQRIIKYTVTVDDRGYWQYGSQFLVNGPGYVGYSTEEQTLGAYYRGYFKAQDLLGNTEVQTETVTATGGTRTLNFGGQVTAPIAYNANAAAIQAALEALPNVAPGDVVVAGAGPYTYTFGGAYAGNDVPLLVVGTTGLTGGTSSVAATSGGLEGVGQLIRGTRDAGMVKFEGVAA